MKKIKVILALFLAFIFVLQPPIVESCCVIPSVRLAGPELSFLAAQQKGLFGKHGLRNDFQLTRTKRVIDLLKQGGEIVGILPSTVAAGLVFHDKNLVIFATLFRGWDYCLWASPALKDLKARMPIPVAVAKGFGMDRLAAYEAFGKYNIPVKGVKLKAIHGFKWMVDEAWKDKGAVVLPVPWKSFAVKKGFEKIYDLSAEEENIPHTVMVTTRDYLKHSPEKLRGVISTFQESLSFAKANEGYMKSLIQRFYSIRDKRIIDSIYKFYILERMTPDIRPTMGMWTQFAEVVKKAGWKEIPKVKRLYDEKVIKELFD